MSRLSYQTSRALTTSQLDQVFQMFLPSPPVLLLCHWWPRSTAELRYKPRNTKFYQPLQEQVVLVACFDHRQTAGKV